ncbi:MAG: polysaccharide deacetylase family protein [Promethearchaeota archaeon]|jgi:hypothetical protein
MNKSKIIITVDTEVGEKAKLEKEGFDKFIMGKIGNEYYGIKKIVEILEDYKIKGEFFVDVYESERFGGDRFEELCKYLHKKGHGVQLHTHPSFAFDINRINMFEYSLDEQIEIISCGKELIKKWIGKYPIAHRAGNYGANNDTLSALVSNRIEIDSSYYHSHNNCKIQLSTINDIIVNNGLIEIPITVIKKGVEIRGFSIPIKQNWLKLDINWLSIKELKRSVEKIDSEYIIIFLHSSSFIHRDESLTKIKEANTTDLKKFNDLLSFFKNNSYEVIGFDQLLE